LCGAVLESAATRLEFQEENGLTPEKCVLVRSDGPWLSACVANSDGGGEGGGVEAVESRSSG